MLYEARTFITFIPGTPGSFLGILFSTLGFVFALWIILQTSLYGDAPGWSSLIVVVLILGGLQLFS